MTSTQRKINLSREELLALPTAVDLVTAANALGISRTKAYRMARFEEFPVPVLRLGNSYRVPTAPLLRFLGIDPDESAHDANTPHPTTDGEADNSPNIRRVLDFSEPVYLKAKSGKHVRIDPDKSYTYKGRRGVSGAEIIEERRRAR
ncbi:hypothetical protein BLA60_39460 [Actinophytocola xinjiangensis]|uniref:Helix-turn-helix protein n=1 Tax=Actinophytocola xinjiangensis TaxID=485602 RepID=A0A7Z0WD90_9PSEU|nr:DNA-binding protein [Actinophytocola xinjiangensis]OLF04701.1 hypothetical protein BLA60_39460 [Actinophytocola xinjiangensis]